MAQVRRVEGQVELQCDAHKYFNVWTRETNRVSEMIPGKLNNVVLHEGVHWHSFGAVKTWDYVLGGRRECLKTKVAEIDEESKTVVYSHIGGDMMEKYYKSFDSKIQAIPNGDQKGCFVKWSFEYEKKTEDAPDADAMLEFVLGVAKDLGARLCNNA